MVKQKKKTTITVIIMNIRVVDVVCVCDGTLLLNNYDHKIILKKRFDIFLPEKKCFQIAIINHTSIFNIPCGGES